ncbi:ABC transporter substrate-binding protein [Paenibacillus luteus]|uniref:ABC transporter substrate-binding protein n=1 Tax=Paenibacillus luteus TaxID=2545753 RepID=UPI001142F234|nr:ABC transporter substrate-binding protein [Paenibacillus luteus]
MKKTAAKLMGLLLISTLFLSACGTESATPDVEAASDTKKDVIMVSEVYHNLLYLPLYVAKEKGFLEQNQIELSSITAAGSGPTALASVISGESTFSFHGPEHVAFAKAKGGDARSLSILSGSAPVWAVANAGTSIETAEDFKGKTIVTGIAPTSSNSLLRKLFADHNISLEKDVTIVEVQNGSELGTLLAGKADIAVVYEPQLDQGLLQGLEIVYDFTKDYPDFAFATLNTSSKVIKENPDLVRRMVNAIELALDYIHSDAEGTKEVAKKEFPNLDSAIVENAVQRMIDSKVYPQDGTLTPSAFQAAIDMQKFIGNLKVDVKYEDMVDTSFMP